MRPSLYLNLIASYF